MRHELCGVALKWLPALMAAALWLCLAGTPASAREPASAGAALTVSDAGHPALMPLDREGAFRPEGTVTRRELCRYLCALLEGLPAGGGRFADFGPLDAGWPQAAALYGAGIIEPGDDGLFRPDQTVTRGELARTLTRLSLHLGDADDLVRIHSTAQQLFALGGVTDPVTRRELAVILESAAGREPDPDALFLGGYLPSDVDVGDESWACMADAAAQGEVPVPAEGVYRAYGWLYAATADGKVMRDLDYGVWTFGLDGRYTTGDEELDGYLVRALAESGADALTGREALEAAYLYVKDNFTYLVRPEDAELVEYGQTGWEYERALRFFRNGGGTCYGFSAAFGLLARALGERAYIVSAQVNEYYSPHGFVIIQEDGIDWIYDVELENTRPERHDDLDLFRIQNHHIYHYWYETDWYGP